MAQTQNSKHQTYFIGIKIQTNTRSVRSTVLKVQLFEVKEAGITSLVVTKMEFVRLHCIVVVVKVGKWGDLLPLNIVSHLSSKRCIKEVGNNAQAIPSPWCNLKKNNDEKRK